MSYCYSDGMMMTTMSSLTTTLVIVSTVTYMMAKIEMVVTMIFTTMEIANVYISTLIRRMMIVS
jgi:hypothetical protein